jgi:hypothetical protein
MFGDGGARIKTGAALIGITTAGHLAIVSMSSSVIDDLLRMRCCGLWLWCCVVANSG